MYGNIDIKNVDDIRLPPDLMDLDGANILFYDSRARIQLDRPIATATFIFAHPQVINIIDENIIMIKN